MFQKRSNIASARTLQLRCAMIVITMMFLFVLTGPLSLMNTSCVWGQQNDQPSQPVQTHPDTVTLISGEVLSGKIIQVTDSTIVFDHPLLGKLTIDRKNVKSFTSGTTAQPQGGQPSQPPAAPPQPPAPKSPPQTPPPAQPKKDEGEPKEAKWLSRIELGINGSEGRTENLDARFRFETKRETKETRLDFDANYFISSSSGDRTANRFDSGVIHDWLWPDSPWLAFVQGRVFIDEFATYDYRITAAGGIGYDFVKNDRTTITGRIGAGASKSFGDPNNDSVVPEALLRLDISHKFTDATKFTFTGEYYPDLQTFGNFRAILDGGIETKIDRARGLSLKFGARDDIERQDHEGNDNDLLTAYATLVFEF